MSAPSETQPQTDAPAGASPIALAILALWVALGVAVARGGPLEGPLTFAFVLVGWVLAVMVHEFGHAFTAWLGGDHSVAAKGYLTLDPRRYLDAGTSLVIPILVLAIGGVGLPGGAVYLRPDPMRGPLWRAAASLAGPLMTLLALLGFCGLAALQAEAFPDAEPLGEALAFLAFLQATALCLNLLPIPGLDGYGALRNFLPGGFVRAVGRREGLIFFGFVLLLLAWPELNRTLFGAAARLADAVGAPGERIIAGYQAFHFWSRP